MFRQTFLLLAVLPLFSLLASPVSFAPIQTLPLNDPAAPVSLALGDFNGDGRRDFGIGYENGHTSVRTNPIGSPGPYRSSREISPLRVNSGGGDVALGDVDRDHIDDWLWTLPQDKRITLTPGGFAAAPSPVTLSRTPIEVQLADLDGDGQLDFLVGYETSPASVMRGNGTGQIGSRSDVSVAGPVLVVADMDGDGAADIISGSAIAPRVSMSRGTGALTFTAPQVIADLPASPNSSIEGLAARPIRAGELPAVAAVVHEPAKRSVYVIRQGASAKIHEGSGQLHAVFADVNRDSVQDLIVADSTLRQIIVFTNNAAGDWNELTRVDTAPHDPSVVVVGDVSGDAIPDLVIGSRTGAALVVFVNTTEPPQRRRATRH